MAVTRVLWDLRSEPLLVNVRERVSCLVGDRVPLINVLAGFTRGPCKAGASGERGACLDSNTCARPRTASAWDMYSALPLSVGVCVYRARVLCVDQPLAVPAAVYSAVTSRAARTLHATQLGLAQRQ